MIIGFGLISLKDERTVSLVHGLDEHFLSQHTGVTQLGLVEDAPTKGPLMGISSKYQQIQDKEENIVSFDTNDEFFESEETKKFLEKHGMTKDDFSREEASLENEVAQLERDVSELGNRLYWINKINRDALEFVKGLPP